MKSNILKIKELFDNASLMVSVKIATSRPLQAAALMSVATAANAGQKISGFTSGWTTEFASLVQFGLLAISGLGIITAAVSTISWVIAKKNQETPKWQVWGMLGGGAAVIAPILVLAVAGSLGNGSSSASNTFNELGISQ